jgi:hypothetical protein
MCCAALLQRTPSTRTPHITAHICTRTTLGIYTIMQANQLLRCHAVISCSHCAVTSDLLPPRPPLQGELERLRNFGYLLATCRPAMASVANAAAAVLVALEDAMMARAEPFEPEVGVVR